jgi:exodeoxyribonuclease V alpha subunit
MSTLSAEAAERRVFAEFCAAGLWPGLGRTLADALPAAGIVSSADVTLDALAALPRVTARRASRLLSSFVAVGPLLELCGLLAEAGVDVRWAARAQAHLGGDAARHLRDDPWALLRLPGIDVNTADRFARQCIPGVTPDDPRRLSGLVCWALARRAREGHTVAGAAEIGAEIAPYGVTDAAAALAAADDAGVIVVHDDDPPRLALARYAQAEESVADSIARLLASAEAIPGSPDELTGELATLDAEQRTAVRHALRAGVSVLTGGPGTGKSRTVAAIVALAERAGKVVELAAPTGRAAKRLEELCGAPASTIHRLLGAQGRRDEDGEAVRSTFARGEDWPLEAEVVVVDEASMLDVELADALLSACPDGAHLVLVGDPAQLPSIGPGRVLGDVIDSKLVPTTEVRTLYRQAEGGTIARLATAVREGELPVMHDPGREVVLVTARGSEQAATRVVQLVTDSIPRALGIPAEQIQVVTPVHRGAAGTSGLNAVLKSRLNPGSGRRRFDPGDRVVATANHLEAEPNGYANGEVGTVKEVSDGVVIVDFASGAARVSGKALADLAHGWAITVHRAQGSEFPAVVVVVPPEAGAMLSRPLIYTALTRAQRHLSVVPAVGPMLRRTVREVGAAPRETRLQRSLHETCGR